MSRSVRLGFCCPQHPALSLGQRPNEDQLRGASARSGASRCPVHSRVGPAIFPPRTLLALTCTETYRQNRQCGGTALQTSDKPASFSYAVPVTVMQSERRVSTVAHIPGRTQRPGAAGHPAAFAMAPPPAGLGFCSCPADTSSVCRNAHKQLAFPLRGLGARQPAPRCAVDTRGAAQDRLSGVSPETVFPRSCWPGADIFRDAWGSAQTE